MLQQKTQKEYQKLAQSKEPKSPLGKDLCLAFLFGGAICVIGQGLFDWFTVMGIEQKIAFGGTGIVLIFLGALLTGFGVYDKLAKHAGAGTIVPITGFSNAIAAPALEFRSEGFVLGMAVKMFTVAGPVLVFGTLTSTLLGLIVWMFHWY